MNTKTLTNFAILAATTGLLVAGIAFAAPPSTAPGQNKLLCFDGTTDGGFGGICTVGNGAKGPATLNNTDSNPAGDYAGVYIQNSTLSGQLLGNVTQLGYNYTGNISPQPGNLSLNVPVSSGAYAFIDAFYCPGTLGVVDVIHDTTCGIFVGSENFPNWAAMVAAHPAWTISTAPAFVIAERTPSEVSAMWTVSNIKLGKAGK